MGFLTVYFNDFLLRIEWNLNLFSRREVQVHINSIFQVTSWCHSPWPEEQPWIWPWICRVPKDTLWGNVHFLSLRFSPLRCELFISMEMWIVNMLISLQHQHIPKRTIQQCTCFQVSWGSLMCLPPFFFFFNYYYFLKKFVVDFVIHWNETAMGLHVFPTPIPPPTSLSTRSL